MLSLKDWSSASTVYAAYASLSGSVMLLQTTFNQLLPRQVRTFIISNVRQYIFKRRNTEELTLIIDKDVGMKPNEIFHASEVFTSTKINPQTSRLKISKTPEDKHITLKLAESETLVDYFHGVEITWRFICKNPKNNNNEFRERFFEEEKQFFEVSFDKKHKDLVLNTYVPFVLENAKAIPDEKKVLKIHTLKHSCKMSWESIKLEHPCTLDTLAMEPSLKKAVMDDLNLFLERKKYYKKVGRAGKRGYLLHGPPGTGKSGLIAAMANFLKFDIYDLQLSNVREDSSLRKLLLSTANKSILVIEDIDCSVALPDRNEKSGRRDLQFTLSGLLNFIDGLWSSCGDERIIIFTTNYKDKLDPALLRPGRMDMHIHMSYLTINAFKNLASNYLDIKDHHWRYGEIEELIGSMEVTPAEVAEELMKSRDSDVCLGGLVNFLKRKQMESIETNDEVANGIELPEPKRQKKLMRVIIYDYITILFRNLLTFQGLASTSGRGEILE